MRVYTYFMVVVSTVILLVLGLLAVLYSSNLLSPQITGFFTGEGKWITGVIGAIFLILALGEVYTGGKLLRKEPAVSFENPLGEVRISYTALEDYLKRMVVGEIGGVKRVKAKLSEGRGGLQVIISAEVEEEQNIPRLTNGLQDRVTSYLKDTLGITSLSQVKVHIVKLTPSRKEKEEEV